MMKRIWMLLWALLLSMCLLACEKDAVTTGPETTPSGTKPPPVTTVPTTPAAPTLPELDTSRYICKLGDQEIEILLTEESASYIEKTKTVMSEATLESLGLTGTIIETTATRVEFSSVSVSVSGNEIMLSGTVAAGYKTVVLTGTAAEAYKQTVKGSLDAKYAEGGMSEEEYAGEIAALNGDETVVAHPFGALTEITVTAQLNDADMTCLVTLVKKSDGAEKMVQDAYAYQNGILSQKNQVDARMFPTKDPTGTIVTYYADGKTVNTYAQYTVEKDGGEWILNNVTHRDEFRQDGTKKQSAFYMGGGILSAVTEYDQRNIETKTTGYAADGTVSYYQLWQETEDTFVCRRYTGDDRLICIQTYRKAGDHRGNLACQTSYDENGGRTENEYYDNGNCKTSVYYAADGSRIEYEYYENGQIKKETHYED